ncbi:cytochrome c biogenesis CcdA family protein [Mycolicibacterium holsaticum]|uniref:Cytochrome C biogenesis protein ResC n=1 Tax=Mycolicibacterium holsaticum TaxID=152142 RepID=A0A1E3R4U0_9MYCO|nr:cytochrome c biogenesis CcdA family protein [Mycolicibacterium holsaticum]MDA4110107.1 cytochrome C biogenesis protein ResC [Mycolicibacterium holsaticum DSM 44478 = JCM 12374]ODQ84751.1 cytochrome C biogenesis protein ResC [Mycolicibacterium holsaticum]QZA11981.1 cytochrome c biogenesis CcdA family protein [Mycolicibacterium holsaticum DSM 44478 = JCM 12374]
MTGFAEIAAAGPVLLALGVCVLAGLVSFASPCVVPLVPGYLSYLAAVVGVAPEDTPDLSRRNVPSGAEVREESARASISTSAETGRAAVRAVRLRVAGAAGLFVAGFTAVFVLGTVAVLGMTTTLITNQLLLQRIGGVVTIVMGLVFVGFIPALQRDARFTPRQLSTVAGAPLLGAIFALGWTPCLGPTLTGVITVASATDGANVARGVALVLAYCLGLGIPFVLLAFGSASAVQGLAWLRRHTRTIQIVGGLLLILVGTALVTGVWNDFVSWVRDAFVSDVTLPI